MTYKETAISGVWVIEPKVFTDQRGYFMEAFKQEEFESIVGEIHFVQDNESCSSKGVLRGLHYQLAPFAQAKLVRVIKGRVLDVAVDIRKGSPTYGKYVAVELSDENKRQLFVPRGVYFHYRGVLYQLGECPAAYADQAAADRRQWCWQELSAAAVQRGQLHANVHLDDWDRLQDPHGRD